MGIVSLFLVIHGIGPNQGCVRGWGLGTQSAFRKGQWKMERGSHHMVVLEAHGTCNWAPHVSATVDSRTSVTVALGFGANLWRRGPPTTASIGPEHGQRACHLLAASSRDCETQHGGH